MIKFIHADYKLQNFARHLIVIIRVYVLISIEILMKGVPQNIRRYLH